MKTSNKVMATYRGGTLTLREFARWLQAFPPQTQAAVAQAADSTLAQFIRAVVRNQMMIASAEADHVALTAADRDSIRMYYRQDLEQMKARLGVTPESLAADSASRRAEVAAHHVDDYFAGLISAPGTHPFFEVPAFLADVLRDRATWSISPAGIDRALEKATELRGPTAPNNLPQMTPAPSGPPLGNQPRGATAPTTRTVH